MRSKDQTGLTHLGAREYDPTLGRFTSVDPVMDLADPQQWNAYTYTSNNPVTWSDPSGLARQNDGGDDTVTYWADGAMGATFGTAGKDITTLGIIKSHMCGGGENPRFGGHLEDMDIGDYRDLVHETWCQNNPAGCEAEMKAIQQRSIPSSGSGLPWPASSQA